VSHNSWRSIKRRLFQGSVQSTHERQSSPKCQCHFDYRKLFHQGRYCRAILLFAKYLVLLKNFRDKNQFLYLARQVNPEGRESLYKAYVNAIGRPHGYLVLYLSQDTDDRLRFRTWIFPTEYPRTFYVDVDDETDKVELQRSSIILNSWI